MKKFAETNHGGFFFSQCKKIVIFMLIKSLSASKFCSRNSRRMEGVCRAVNKKGASTNQMAVYVDKLSG